MKWKLLLCSSCIGLVGWAPALIQAQGTGPPREQQTHTSDRVAAVVPAFNVSNDIHAPALSSRQKFKLFSKTAKDPYTLVMPAINALILSAGGVSSGYGSGFGGAAKKYAASLADSTTGNFMRLYAYPSLLHEDPRYFRKGTGSILGRTGRVFVATVKTRKDQEEFRFNWSKLLSSFTSAAISNTYYPEKNRGVALTFSRVGLSYVGEVGYNALKEFGPDIFGRKQKGKQRKQ